MNSIVCAVLIAYIVTISVVERRYLCKLIKADKVKEVESHSKPTKFFSAHNKAVESLRKDVNIDG